ncbi:hypothetical protein PFICI_14699 [Pestalotiopsis fici W106-1]|uniref:RRM domain-containing protein n=1 Tax=Pestalotiopsis fici (strain W106-1 / CGMCC3.15140) TaxID=1229662 RepID=W3WIR1_PESFW|nr:uncharacterized protein PFICI_14699 [Pestalotiopsis fici W106-1]ETS73753.1 hypothetical protein PFICI_14699 [Pestalotiopsis fici W106-1]
MTDNPELVATADLTPQSPKPINLSSPASVPALQDQADTLSTMALSPSEDLVTVDVTSIASQSINGIGAEQTHTESDANTSSENVDLTTVDTTSHEVSAQESGEQEDDEDQYAKDFDSPVPDAIETSQDGQAVSTNGVVANQDTFSSEISANMPSIEQAAPSTSAPVAEPNGINTQASTATSALTGPGIPTSLEEPTGPRIADGDGIDIQALVDTITARNTSAVPNDQPEATPSVVNPDVASSEVPQSLPPKPPVSQQPPALDVLPQELHKFQPMSNGTTQNMVSAHGLSYTHPPNGAPVPLGYVAPAVFPPGVPGQQAGPYDAGGTLSHNQSQRYDEFLKEERKYVSEAKWDRFPEGSRLFIGNLSSERATKKEVFDIFSPYGRLAQISLKQAYGFVQYHTVAEGQAATDALQGIEISGRKIHLEFSRAQKKDGDGDRRGPRGARTGSVQQNDRDRTRFDGRRNDGYRARSPSPSRGPHSRQGSYGRAERGQWDAPSDYARRDRSRSPMGYGGGHYRRRSPSPYRRGLPKSEADLDIQRRYGADVPDVQLLLLQEVNRDFVAWVQGAFAERGLKVDVMFLDPRFPRDLVIQRQIVEGVHGVTELNYHSQSMAKIPLQMFDRSTGRHNARFDQYQDLDPKIAAEIVVRAKAQSHSQSQMQAPASYGNNGYYPPAAYPAPQPMAQQMPPHMASQYPGMPGQVHPSPYPGSVDNATIQRVLSAFHGNSGAHVPSQQQMAPGPGVDVNAVLHALGANGSVPPPQQQQALTYPPPPPQGHPGQGHPSQGNPTDQAYVQDIMAQLSRYRQ